MPGLHAVGTYSFNRQDRIVFDTNTLILIHLNTYGNPRDPRIAVYTAAYKQILGHGSEKILLDVVLSEFIHAVERSAARTWALHQGKSGLDPGQVLKAFRQDTKLHDKAMSDIDDEVSRILSTHRLDKVASLTSSTTSGFLDHMRRSRADLNDVLIADYCQRTGASLLTADRDLRVFSTRVDVITEP